MPISGRPVSGRLVIPVAGMTPAPISDFAMSSMFTTGASGSDFGSTSSLVGLKTNLGRMTKTTSTAMPTSTRRTTTVTMMMTNMVLLPALLPADVGAGAGADATAAEVVVEPVTSAREPPLAIKSFLNVALLVVIAVFKGTIPAAAVEDDAVVTENWTETARRDVLSMVTSLPVHCAVPSVPQMLRYVAMTSLKAVCALVSNWALVIPAKETDATSVDVDGVGGVVGVDGVDGVVGGVVGVDGVDDEE